MHLCVDYASSMNKRERQQKILSLIQAKPIGTQEDLRALLEQTGVAATQSSVSRDLEELGIVNSTAITRCRAQTARPRADC